MSVNIRIENYFVEQGLWLRKAWNKMGRRGLALVLSICVMAGFGLWRTGVFQSDPAHAAEAKSMDGVENDPGKFSDVAGFRSAKFGDTEEAVRSAISKDFSKSTDDIKVVENPVQRTKVLVVDISDLIPETGKARVSYIFGYKSKALIQVSILWGTSISPETTDVKIARTALVLKNYFSGQGFDPKRTVRDRDIKNGVVVFQSVDKDNRLVRLLYVSAPALVSKTDKSKPTDAKTRYALNLAYVANPVSPDIFSIKSGAF